MAETVNTKKTMIQDILRQSKEKHKFIGVWIYGDDEGFWSGRVQELTEEFVVIEHFTKYGKPDGVVIEAISNIESIDFDDDYSKSMEYLIVNHHLLDEVEEISVKMESLETWPFNLLESLIGNKETIVQIQVNRDSFYSGLVEWVEETELLLRMIGDQGQDNGKSLFKLEDISAVRINNLSNRRKLLLYKWRKEINHE